MLAYNSRKGEEKKIKKKENPETLKWSLTTKSFDKSKAEPEGDAASSPCSSVPGLFQRTQPILSVLECYIFFKDCPSAILLKWVFVPGSGKERWGQAVSSCSGHVACLGAVTSASALKERESTAEPGWDSSSPRGIFKLLLIRAQKNRGLILPRGVLVAVTKCWWETRTEKQRQRKH